MPRRSDKIEGMRDTRTDVPAGPSDGTVAAERRAGWSQDPEGVKRDILAVAKAEFEKGLSGARVNDIAAKTATSKRMIYYYFKDKEGLYLAVLEAAYARIRGLEAELDLANLSPKEALARLAGFTFDYHADNPDFVRLVMVENIHRGEHLARSKELPKMNPKAVSTIEAVYRRGVAEGVFRDGLKPLDIHLAISALSFYNVSNRASITFGFGHDMGLAEARVARRAFVIDLVLRGVARD
jgi:AcrR family transcriptional regulator